MQCFGKTFLDNQTKIVSTMQFLTFIQKLFVRFVRTYRPGEAGKKGRFPLEIVLFAMVFFNDFQVFLNRVGIQEKTSVPSMSKAVFRYAALWQLSALGGGPASSQRF